MAQKFAISTDRQEVERAVQQIEQDIVFRSIQAIKSLRLSNAEEQIVLEIARRGRCTLEQLQTNLPTIADLPILLKQMIAKTWLVEAPAFGQPVYVLSFVLQPPRPISPDVAHAINTEINQAGGATTTYVRHIYKSLGAPGLQIVASVMSDQGEKYASALAEVQGATPAVVGKRFAELMQANGAKLEIIPQTPEQAEQQFIFRQHECPYKLSEGETALCDAVNHFDKKLLGALGCEITYSERLVEGAKYCQAVIRKLKKPQTTPELLEERAG